MADLIDRDAVLSILAGIARTQGEYDESYDKLMQIPSANRWIPCSERLPENDAKCLVYTSDKRVCMARWYGKYDEQGAWYIISDAVPKLYRIKNVPFWMPLPEPPEGGETSG